MITHVVLCWMDKDKEEQREELISEAYKLRQIPGIEKVRVGKPVSSTRGVVDDSFSFGISVEFKDALIAESYQAHPIHHRFVCDYLRPHVRRFLVYDIDDVSEIS